MALGLRSISELANALKLVLISASAPQDDGLAEIDRADRVLEIVGDRPRDLQAKRPFDFFRLDVRTLFDESVDDQTNLAGLHTHSAQRADKPFGVLGAGNIELHHQQVDVARRQHRGIKRGDAHERIDHDVVEHARQDAQQSRHRVLGDA